MSRSGCRLLILAVTLSGCVASTHERFRDFNDDGVQLFARGDYRNALDSFDSALTLQPQDAALLYNIGQCYDHLGDAPHAEQYYRTCVERSPKHADARMALAALQYRVDRREQANQMIQDWLAAEPNCADAYVLDAWKLRQERAIPLAQGRLQQALSLEPHNPRALIEMATLNEMMGHPDRAYSMYEWILVRNPGNTEASARLESLKSKGVRRPLPD